MGSPIEKIVYMQTEYGMVSFERSDGTTIIYPADKIPSTYREGDIINAIVHNEDKIDFISLDLEAMKEKRERVRALANRLRKRARRATNRHTNPNQI